MALTNYYPTTWTNIGSILDLILFNLSSDGKAPHFMNIKFKRATRIVQIHLNLNYEKDESYTPNRIILRAGYDEYNIVQVFEFDIVKPKGWTTYNVSTEQDDICTFFYQLIFPYNYLSGKDLRIRGFRLIAGRDSESAGTKSHDVNEDELFLRKHQTSPILR